MKFHEYFESNADAFPERAAATFDGKSVVYGELNALAERHRAALVGHGARPGDRVVLYAELSAEAVAAVIGILKAGCVVVTTHPSFDRRKLVHQAREADAAFLVTDRPDVFEGVFDETPLDAVLPLGGGPEAEPLLRRRPPAVPRSDDAGISLEGELAALFYTSGSSSAPKGVAVSHGNMVAAFEAVTSYQANTADDVVLTFTPIGSDFGFHNVMMPLAFGGRVVACRSLPEDPRALIDLVNREGVTGLHAFPPVLARLCGLDDLHRYEAPSLRYVSSSGQRLPVEHIRRLRDAFPRVLIHSMYGLTECKRVSYLPPDEIDRHPDSVGRPLPGVRAHIVGDDGRPVTEPGAVGELAVAGDLVMQGYWRRPELTDRVIRRDVLGESRLLLTGDLFRRDRDGLLYWVARRDEVFARSVFKVDPHEVEARIRELPGVADCAVVPVADDSAGSVPVACVVPRDRAGVGEREVIDHCAERLDWHMVPARVVFHRRLPLTASGKTDRRALARALEESGRDGAKGGAR